MPIESQEKNLSLIDAYLRNQTAYLQGSIVHADQKASFLLPVLVILSGYLGSTQPLFGVKAILLPWQGWTSVPAWFSLLAAVFFVLAASCAGRAVWPRYDPKAAKGSAAFAAIAVCYPSPESFAEDLLKTTDEEIIKKQLRSHHYRCVICLSKWRLLKWAYGFSAIGFLLLIVYFVLSGIVG